MTSVTNRDGETFLLGGFDPSNGEAFNSVYKFNPKDQNLTTQASFNHPRGSFGFCTTKQSLFICGGRKSDSHVVGSFEKYDFLDNSWEILLDSSYPAVKPLLINFNDEFIYKLGGVVNNCKIKLKKAFGVRLERYNIRNRRWEELDYEINYPESMLDQIGFNFKPCMAGSQINSNSMFVRKKIILDFWWV